MVSINYAFKEIISKIVYYGPGLSGKTTNLQHVFKKVPKDTRGELISLATDADRTLYFDFLPVNVGKIRGFDIKFQLYTVPGQVYYNATRKLVLRGVDGLVFVADSQLDKMDENIESLKNLEENLAEYGYILKELPLVIQYNKRDLPKIATIEQLEQLLNPRGVPYFEAVATQGSGVFGTLKAISKLVIDKAKKGGSDKSDKSKPVVMFSGGSQFAEN
jgi:signal recognition particle receptor subunit beta